MLFLFYTSVRNTEETVAFRNTVDSMQSVFSFFIQWLEEIGSGHEEMMYLKISIHVQEIINIILFVSVTHKSQPPYQKLNEKNNPKR